MQQCGCSGKGRRYLHICGNAGREKRVKVQGALYKVLGITGPEIFVHIMNE